MEQTGIITDQQTHQPIRLHADYGQGFEGDYTLALFSYTGGVPALVALPDDENYPPEPISVNLADYGFASSETVFWANPDTPTLTRTLLASAHAEPETSFPEAHYGIGGRETSRAIRLVHVELPGSPVNGIRLGGFDLDDYYENTLPSIKRREGEQA